MKQILLFIIFMFLIGGCSRTKINVRYDKNADYNRFETFGWLKSTRQVDNLKQINNQRLDRLITSVVDSMMTGRGYELLTEGDPDLLITYYAGVSGKIELDEAGYSYGKWVEDDENIEQQGVLLIDIIDNEKRELFWRGKGSGLVDDQEDARDEVIKIAEKIFDQFPERNID